MGKVIHSKYSNRYHSSQTGWGMRFQTACGLTPSDTLQVSANPSEITCKNCLSSAGIGYDMCDKFRKFINMFSLRKHNDILKINQTLIKVKGVLKELETSENYIDWED